MSRGPLFLSASSGLASLAASNPTALSDLTGCGVRIGHNSAAEVLQAAMGRTVARSGSRQSWADARAPAGHGSSCGPSGAALCQIGKRLPISNRRPSGWPSEAGRMPGHRQCMGAAAGLLWPAGSKSDSAVRFANDKALNSAKR